MEQVRELASQLGFPGANKLWNEVRKRNIDVPKDEVRKYVRSLGLRHVFQRRPAYEGRIAATEINNRWVADLIDYNAKPSPDKKGGEPYQYILIVQDRFSRVLFAHALKTKDPEVVKQAFESIVRRAGLPDVLDTDHGNEFTGAFKDYLQEERIRHNVSDVRNKNARATLDAAIKGIRQQIARISVAEDRRDWASFLTRAIEAHNTTEHSSLIGRAPYQIHWDDDAKFNLRYKAAEDLKHNSDLIERRGQRLQQEGGFRNEEPIKNKFERAFTPHFEGKVHPVSKVIGPTVYDEEGKPYPTRHVLPVERSSEAVNTTNIAGGSARIDRVRLEKLEPHRAAITAFVGAGKTENEVVRYMKTLGMDQLTNAGFNFRSMLKLLGFSTGEGKGSSTAMVRNLAAAPAPAAVAPAAVRAGPLRRITGKRAPLTPAEAAPVRRRLVGKQAPP
ncbi:MAG: transposase family protein [Deltaproteobacteria bacterium]|nr:transposase family protein [Deltaproteobacteria bacterium]